MLNPTSCSTSSMANFGEKKGRKAPLRLGQTHLQGPSLSEATEIPGHFHGSGRCLSHTAHPRDRSRGDPLAEERLSHSQATSRLWTGGPWRDRGAGSRMSLPSPPPLHSETSSQAALKTKGTASLAPGRAGGWFLTIGKTDNVVIQSLLSRVRFSCELTDCSPPGSSAHGMLQASIRPPSRGSSGPRD